MLKSETSTDPWELEDEEFVTVDKGYYEVLLKDSALLYALRKIGAVPYNIEEEARDFLAEEGDIDA